MAGAECERAGAQKLAQDGPAWQKAPPGGAEDAFSAASAGVVQGGSSSPSNSGSEEGFG
jgi:hypothetical protein